MSIQKFARNRSSFAVLAALGLLCGPSALAQQMSQPNFTSAGEIETVVVTGTAFNPDTAPAKASLETMEPQTSSTSPISRIRWRKPPTTPRFWRLRPA